MVVKLTFRELYPSWLVVVELAEIKNIFFFFLQFFTMVSNVSIKGYDEFVKFLKNIDNNGPPVYFYFSGSKTPDGNSWCPDCVVG